MEWIEIREIDNGSIKGKIVSVIAEIRKNSTGEIREYVSEEILENDTNFPSVFNWEENNYSCDCNRHIFFKRACNEVVTDDDFERECSDGKYSVNLKNKKDGKIYYKEF